MAYDALRKVVGHIENIEIGVPGKSMQLDVLLDYATVSINAYRNNPKYWDRQAFAKSVDPDQTPHNVASDQGLHCLPNRQQYLRHIKRW